MRRLPHSRHGMTVVEIIVVMAIVASIMGLGASMLGMVGNNDMKKDANRLSSVMNYTYSNAGINNSRYRLVLDLDTGTYYSEVTDQALITQSERDADLEMLTEEAREAGRQKDRDSDLFDEEEENPFGVNRRVTFERVQNALVKDEKLSEGIRFDKIYSPRFPDGPVTEGKMAISFFPNGYVEPVLIILRDDDDGVYSLITEPMTGRVKLYGREIEVPKDFGEAEVDDD